MSQLTTTTQENPIAVASAAMMMNPAHMQALVSFADMMAKSAVTVPKHLQGKPSDCLAIAMQATQWGMNPFAVAQKTHLTQGGTLGYEAQLVNAVIISRAPIAARPEYEFLGDWSRILGKVKEMSGQSGGKYYVADWKKDDEAGLGVIVRVTMIGETTPREIKVMMSQAYPRFSTQWATDPQQQITYLAIRKWARRYAPDVILGVYTEEELSDIQPATREMGSADVVGAGTSRTTLPAYSDDQFEKNLPAWTQLIVDGKKTAERVISSIQSKATLSDAQKERILAIKPATVIENQTATSAALHPLAAQMDKAEDEDALNLIADQIREITDTDVVETLRKSYETNLYRLTKG